MDELTVRVTGKQRLTPRIWQFELRPADGQELPEFSAGAHINVRPPSGERRSYSLNNAEPDRYVIAVAREDGGRGGSVSMAGETVPGDLLTISAPVNAFELRPASRHLLIAGGIGITPIRAMFRALRGKARLLYLTRSAEETAYRDELAGDEAVILHHSRENGRL